MKRIDDWKLCLCAVLVALAGCDAPLHEATAVSVQGLISINWQQLPGAALDIGVGANGAAWVITSTQGIAKWNGSSWQAYPGAAVRIAVGPDGGAWVVNAQGAIFRWVGTTWQQMPGAAQDIGIGADGTIAITGPGGGIARWDGSAWQAYPGAAVRIAVGPAGNPWVVNAQGLIFHWIGTGWEQLPGTAQDIGVGANGSVFIIGTTPIVTPTERPIYQWTGADWAQTVGTAVQVSVGPSGDPWVVNSSGNTFGSGSMTVLPTPRPAAVTGLVPGNGTVFPATTTAVTFAWTPVAGMNRYLVRCVDTTTGQTVAYDDAATAAPVQLPVTPGHTYSFWVHAATADYPGGDTASYGDAAGTVISISTAIADGVYRLRSAYSNKCLDVPFDSRSHGVYLWQWDCGTQGNQLWSVAAQGNGQYRITGYDSGTCLDIDLLVGAATNGARAQIWDCQGAPNQAYNVLPWGASGTFQVKPVHSGKCLDSDLSNGPVNAAKIQQWDCNPGQSTQLWSFEPISNPPAVGPGSTGRFQFAGYQPPRNKQGVGDAVANVFFPLGAATDQRFQKMSRDFQVGINNHNLWWANWENGPPSFTDPSIGCPFDPSDPARQYARIPDSETERIAYGYHRYHCIHLPDRNVTDFVFRRDRDNGVQTAIVLWNSPPMYRHPSCVTRSNPILTGGGCVPAQDIGGYDHMDDYEDFVTLLAQRYNGQTDNGKITHWIIWNEANSQLWFDTTPYVNARTVNPSPSDLDYWLNRYADMLGRTNRALWRTGNRGAMIYGSFTSFWDGTPSDPNMTHIPGTWLAQGLWDRLGIAADWSIALHAYGDSSQQGDPWSSSVREISLLGQSAALDFQYAHLRAKLNGGPYMDVTQYPQAYIFNSEQGWLASSGMPYQARSICRGYAAITGYPTVIGATYTGFQSAPQGGDDVQGDFSFFPFAAGVDLASADQYITYQAYKSTHPAVWGHSSGHYCCQTQQLGCGP